MSDIEEEVMIDEPRRGRGGRGRPRGGRRQNQDNTENRQTNNTTQSSSSSAAPRNHGRSDAALDVQSPTLSGLSSSSQKQQQQQQHQAPRRERKGFNDEASSKDKYADTDKMLDLDAIEDVGEEQEPDLAFQVANAPHMSNQVIGLGELGRDMGFNLPSSSGIDLSLLTSVLLPRENTIDNDKTWTFESIFTDVSSAMRNEQEGPNNNDEEGKE